MNNFAWIQVHFGHGYKFISGYFDQRLNYCKSIFKILIHLSGFTDSVGTLSRFKPNNESSNFARNTLAVAISISITGGDALATYSWVASCGGCHLQSHIRWLRMFVA